MPTALLWSSPLSPPSSDAGFHASLHLFPSPASRNGRPASTLIPGAWPPAWDARTRIAAPGFGAYLAVPWIPSSTYTKLKNNKN